MTGRVCVRVVPLGQWSSAKRQHPRLGDGEVIDHHVEVELLRTPRIRPCPRILRAQRRSFGKPRSA